MPLNWEIGSESDIEVLSSLENEEENPNPLKTVDGGTNLGGVCWGWGWHPLPWGIELYNEQAMVVKISENSSTMLTIIYKIEFGLFGTIYEQQNIAAV
jgi:hypothetical protein